MPIVAAMAPEYMTEPTRRSDADGLDPSKRVDRVLDARTRRHRHRPRARHRRRTCATSSGRSSIARRCRWCSTPTRLNAFADDPDRLRGREGRDVIITPHPGRDGAAGRHVDRRSAGQPRSRSRANFAAAHQLHVVLKGHRTLIATPDENVLHQPDRQPGHGDRRHRRRPHRHHRRVAGAVARCRSRVRSSASTCMAWPAISPRPTGRSRDDRRRPRRLPRRRAGADRGGARSATTSVTDVATASSEDRDDGSGPRPRRAASCRARLSC